MFMTRILTYKREEIEKFIKKFPNTKEIFEKCGNFLENNYLILSKYSNEIIVDKEVLFELEDEMLDDFENIKYEDIILKDYVDLVKDYFCKNN